MRQAVTVLLMMLMGHVTSGQQYPDCNINCRRSGECDVYSITVEHDVW